LGATPDRAWAGLDRAATGTLFRDRWEHHQALESAETGVLRACCSTAWSLKSSMSWPPVAINGSMSRRSYARTSSMTTTVTSWAGRGHPGCEAASPRFRCPAILAKEPSARALEWEASPGTGREVKASEWPVGGAPVSPASASLRLVAERFHARLVCSICDPD